MLSDNDLAMIRTEVGDTPGDSEIEDIFDRVETIGGTIYEVLSRRLANMLAAPAQFQVPGEYGENRAANIAALQKQLERWASFAPIAGTSNDLGIIQLESRHSRSRVHSGAFDTED